MSDDALELQRLRTRETVLDAQVVLLKRDQFVPDELVCGQCGFVQRGAGSGGLLDRLCPNDGAALQRQTWKDRAKEAMAATIKMGARAEQAETDRDSWAKLMVEVRESAEDALRSGNTAKWEAILESIDARITEEISRSDKAGAFAALAKDARVLGRSARMSGRCAGTHAVAVAGCQFCKELGAALTRHAPEGPSDV